MNRHSRIKERLRRYISEETDTDAKLEEGSISDWVLNSDNDMEWLLSVNADLLEALQALSSNPHIHLGDLVYYVREREGEGWDGPAVTAWGEAVDKAKAAIKKATEGGDA